MAIGDELSDEERAIVAFLKDTLSQAQCPTRFGF